MKLVVSVYREIFKVYINMFFSVFLCLIYNTIKHKKSVSLSYSIVDQVRPNTFKT